MFFDLLLDQVDEKTDVICQLLKKNHRLRGIIFGEDDKIREWLKANNELELIEEYPNDIDWRIYEHCSVITQLYAIYDNFVEALIKNWLKSLPNIIESYSELDIKIQDAHARGVGNLLMSLNKPKYKHLTLEQIIQGLYYGVARLPEFPRNTYTLIPEAFLERDQNLRKSELERLLRGIGIENCWSWIEKHKDIKNFIENVRGGENTAEAELEQWIKYRNEAAHTIVEDNWLGFNELLDLTIFVKAICQSLADLLSYHKIILMKKYNQATVIGEIRQYFDRQKVVRVKATDGTISTHSKIFLINKEISICKAIKIDNIRLKVSEDRVEDKRELLN